MRILAFGAACALLLTPSAAFAEETAKKDDRYDPDKMICKNNKVTGSRLVKERVCMTRKQWDELAARSQAAHEESMELGRRINAGGGPGQ